jgi:hypothetical protein
MKGLGLNCYAVTLCSAAAMLTGCGGSQPPIGARGAILQTLAVATHAHRDTSWMQARATDEDLLYVGDGFYPFTVSVYNYKTDKLVGQLSGSFYEPSGMRGHAVAMPLDHSTKSTVTRHGLFRRGAYADGKE